MANAEESRSLEKRGIEGILKAEECFFFQMLK